MNLVCNRGVIIRLTARLVDHGTIPLVTHIVVGTACKRGGGNAYASVFVQCRAPPKSLSDHSRQQISATYYDKVTPAFSNLLIN